MKKKWTIYDYLSMAVIGVLTFLFIFPFYWVVTGSFKDQKVTIKLPPEWFPLEPTFANYTNLFGRNPAWQWFINTVIISLIAMLLVCVVSTMAGYVLAKKRFYGGTILFTMFVASMALPKQVVLVPLVRLASSLGIHDSMWAVILPAVGWPFGIFLMKQFSQSIPSELLEAARIDGCNEFQTFWHVVLNMVKPGIGALAIFTFISTWNDYFLQLIMLTSRENLTLQLGIATLQAELSTNYGMLMAGATFSAIPIILIFILFQKSFTQGITMGAVKG
ncbi:MAG: carbohydrate ABC transporter permease [Cellulosilyticaceae bacterium]